MWKKSRRGMSAMKGSVRSERSRGSEFGLVRDGNRVEWIMHGNTALAKFDRKDLHLSDVKFAPRGRPLLSHVPLAWTIFKGRAKNISVRASGGPSRLRLELSCGNRKGNLSGKTVLSVTLDPRTKTYVYSIKTALKVEKRWRLTREKEPWQGYTNWFDKCKGTRFEKTGLWYMQYGDPAVHMGVGPATPITRDRPDILYPYPFFKRGWKKRWQACIYQDPKGKYVSVPHNHLLSSDKDVWEMRKGGMFGWFDEPGGNPVIRFPGNTGSRTACHMCQWAYDVHLWYVLDGEGSDPVLEPGTELKASYEIACWGAKRSSAILKKARAAPLLPGDCVFCDLPAYRPGMNAFRDAVKPVDESWYWTPGGSTVWDRTQGHRGSNSLKIEHDVPQRSSWYAMVGRSYFMDPLVDGKRYRLSAWVKTSGVSGTGARISVSQTAVADEGTARERVKSSPCRYSGRKLTGTRDWTRVEVVSTVVRRGAAYLTLALELDGTGIAWFSDVKLEPIRRQGGTRKR